MHQIFTAAARRWRVIQGRSSAVVVAPDIEAARRRAAQIGLKNPDSIVLHER
jgi:transcription initiation factor TFIIIB Brf1 subunit/transcription initiation factor TFIIB